MIYKYQYSFLFSISYCPTIFVCAFQVQNTPLHCTLFSFLPYSNRTILRPNLPSRTLLNMATILYKKYMSKKRENMQKPRESCEHQQMSQSSQAPLELSSMPIGRQDDGYQNTNKDQANLTFNTTMPCSICSDEKRAMKMYRRRLIAGLVLPFLLQSLDITIISGALPFIASDFRSSSSLIHAFLNLRTDLEQINSLN
jgi:hypothetical protein